MTVETKALTRIVPNSIADLEQQVGSELGVSRWQPIAQADIDAFAAVTGDSQWIHTAAREPRLRFLHHMRKQAACAGTRRKSP